MDFKDRKAAEAAVAAIGNSFQLEDMPIRFQLAKRSTEIKINSTVLFLANLAYDCTSVSLGEELAKVLGNIRFKHSIKIDTITGMITFIL